MRQLDSVAETVESSRSAILDVGHPCAAPSSRSPERLGGRRGTGSDRSGRGWPTLSSLFLVSIGHNRYVTTAWNSEKDADARRARRKRVLAQRALEPAPPPQPPAPPLGDAVEGIAGDLDPGDVVLSWGSDGPGRKFKRNTLGDEWVVEWQAPKPGARTRTCLAFTNGRSFTLRHDYPVRYRRPITTT